MINEDLPFDLTRPQIRDGIKVGSTAYMFGILLIYLLSVLIRLVGPRTFGNIFPPVTAGFYDFYHAHGMIYEFISLYSPQNIWLALLPPALLVSAGYLLHRRSGMEDRTPRSAILTGSLVVIGYFPLALLGTIVVMISRPWYQDILHPIVVLAVFGVFPVVFGGLGAYISYATPGDGTGATASPGGGTSAGALLTGAVATVRERPLMLGVFIVGALVSDLFPTEVDSFAFSLFFVVGVMVAGRGLGLQMDGGVGDRFVIGFVAYVLSVIGVLFGLLLLILPGLYLWVKFYLVVPAAVFGGAGPISSLSESYALTDGAFWSIFGALLVFIGGGLGVGVVVSIATDSVLVGWVCTALVAGAGLAGSQTYLYREAVSTRSPDQTT